MNTCCTQRQVVISRQRQHGPGNPGAQRCPGAARSAGDAKANPDPLMVEYAGVLSTVTAHIPFIGIYAGALNTLPGKLYAFGFIVAAAMLYLLAHELSE